MNYTMMHGSMNVKTTSGFQFCVPHMNVRTTVHNEAYLNKTDCHKVKTTAGEIITYCTQLNQMISPNL
jgi:hypothetical protein